MRMDGPGAGYDPVQEQSAGRGSGRWAGRLAKIGLAAVGLAAIIAAVGGAATADEAVTQKPNSGKPAATSQPAEDLEGKVSGREEDKIFDLHKQLADTYYDKGDYKSAADEYEKASVAKPNDADTMYKYALSRILNNEFDRNTGRVLEALLKSDPCPPQAYLLLQRYYLKGGETSETEAEDATVGMMTAIGGLFGGLDPNTIDTPADKRKRVEAKAQRAYDKWASLVATPETLKLHDKGCEAEKNEDYVEAEGFFREALQRSPRFAYSWASLGHLLKKQKRLEEAIEAYTRAIDSDPLNHRLWFYRGAAYFRLRTHNQEALRDFETAYRISEYSFAPAKQIIEDMKKNNLVPK